MFVIVAAIAATVALIVHLSINVRNDRPSTPPRSHSHEVDRYPSHTH